MKRLTVASLALAMVLSACGSNGGSTTATDSTAGTSETSAATEQAATEEALDWSAYDDLIAQIRTTTDMEEREALMHQAEDMLMGTGALLPIYYYTDVYMVKEDVTGIYLDPQQHKFFQFAKTDRDSLNVQVGSEPSKVDPALNTASDASTLDVNLFSGLMTYDSDKKLATDLAEKYEVSEDGLTYTFTLLPDLKWSDGSALTAADFVYSWNRLADEKTAADYFYLADVIARNDDGTLKVTASEDGQTLTVEMVAPCAYFLDLCAMPTFYPVPQASVEAADGWEANPGAWAQEAGFVTNGAYTMEKWDHEVSMVFKKNPNYHKADQVSVETVNFMLSSDDTAIYAAYQAGDLDFIDSLATDEMVNMKQSSEYYAEAQLGTYYAVFNVNSPMFEGKTDAQASAMRRAFALLIDRDYIVDNIGQADQIPASSFIPAGMSDGHGGIFKENDAAYTYPSEESVGYYPLEVTDENLEMARELLKEAGFEFGDDGMLSADTPIDFEYMTNITSGHIAIAEAIQQDLAAIGINMTIKQLEWNVFLEERKAGNYDVARNGWNADYNDPINMLEMWTTDSGNNDAQLGR